MTVSQPGKPNLFEFKQHRVYVVRPGSIHEKTGYPLRDSGAQSPRCPTFCDAVYVSSTGAPDAAAPAKTSSPACARCIVMCRSGYASKTRRKKRRSAQERTSFIKTLLIAPASGLRSPGVKVPHIPGSDVAGEIVEVGEYVTGFKHGQRILLLCRSNFSLVDSWLSVAPQ